MKTIYLAGDHAGFTLKTILGKHLTAAGFEVTDLGTDGPDSVDYPDFAHALSLAVAESQGKGILVCGSGNGVCITANKHAGIRAALAWTAEVARLARAHNDANVLCLPARFIDEATALAAADAFLAEPFEGGRHRRRVEKIAAVKAH